MGKELIKVARKKVGKELEIVDIERSLESLRNEVGDFLEYVVFDKKKGLCIICNEVGGMLGLKENLIFYRGLEEITIRGDLLIVKYSEGKEVDLEPIDITYLVSMFEVLDPEEYEDYEEYEEVE